MRSCNAAKTGVSYSGPSGRKGLPVAIAGDQPEKATPEPMAGLGRAFVAGLPIFTDSLWPRRLSIDPLNSLVP